MNRLLKLSIWPLGVVALTGLYFSSNIRGYYRFQEVCQRDAGLRMYEPLLKGEGWQTLAGNSDSAAAYLLSYYDGISYVRYRDKDGILQDLIRTNEKKSRSDSGFRPKLASSGTQPLYEYQSNAEEVAGEVRMNKYTTIVRNLRTGGVSVTYQDFTYRLFNPEWGLGRGTSCSSLMQGNTSKSLNDSREVAIRSAFVK